MGVENFHSSFTMKTTESNSNATIPITRAQ